MVSLSVGKTDKTKELLIQIENTPNLRQIHQDWLTQIQGDLQLKLFQGNEALKTFSKLKTKHQNNQSPYLRLRSMMGLAKSYQQLGDVDNAIETWNTIQDDLRNSGLLVPVHEGRELFLSQHNRASEEFVDFYCEMTVPWQHSRS